MKQLQNGFTLIELIMVIVILGILAATAIPKYQDLSEEARTSANQGMAGALGAASAINYATRTVNSTKGIPISNCASIEGALTDTMPTNFSITSAPITAGSTATCTVTNSDGGTDATFTGHGIN